MSTIYSSLLKTEEEGGGDTSLRVLKNFLT